MRPSSRTRLLLLALVAVAMACACARDVDDGVPPASADAKRLVPVAVQTIPTYYPGGGLPDVVMSDSEFARMLPEYGVLLMLRHESPAGDTASYYYVAPLDSTRSLRDLGFVQAASLLDSTAQFVTLGDSLPSSIVRSRSRAGNDSVLRRRDSDCVLESPIPVVGPGSASSAWIMALVPGAAEAIPPRTWRTPVTAEDVRLALALAEVIVPDSMERLRGSPPEAFSALPVSLRSIHHFSFDGTEYLIADVRRECTTLECFRQRAEDDQEQRVFVAERDAGDTSAPYRITWRRYVAGSSDRNKTYEPALMLRMGPDRLLTLYLVHDLGGIFLARSGPHTWSPVAEWYGGC